MAKNNQHSLTYIRFLNLAHAIRGLPSFPAVDPLEERLLSIFASAWHDNRLVTVLEAMRISADASPSTVHRRLKSLRKKGLIDLTLDETDNRIKYIVQTDLTTQYFAKLGQCLNEATIA